MSRYYTIETIKRLEGELAAEKRENAELRSLLGRAVRELSEEQERLAENGQTPSGPVFHILQEYHALKG